MGCAYTVIAVYVTCQFIKDNELYYVIGYNTTTAETSVTVSKCDSQTSEGDKNKFEPTQFQHQVPDTLANTSVSYGFIIGPIRKPIDMISWAYECNCFDLRNPGGIPEDITVFYRIADKSIATCPPGFTVAYVPKKPSPAPRPTIVPTAQPTGVPTHEPTVQPTSIPTAAPISQPTNRPTHEPTAQPTSIPTAAPIAQPTNRPTHEPTAQPTSISTREPTTQPTNRPTHEPTTQPTGISTREPTVQPTNRPTAMPTIQPTGVSTAQPTTMPTRSSTSSSIAPIDVAIPTQNSDIIPIIIFLVLPAVVMLAFYVRRVMRRIQ